MSDLLNNFQFEKTADSVKEYLSGKVKEHDGFVYVDVPSKVLDAFLPLIGDDKAEKPPQHNDTVNAHITVIKKSETKKLKEVKGLGDTVKFTITGLKSVDPEGWDEMDKCWFLECESKDLEKVRKSNGLTPLVAGDHAYHITLAVRRK